ncbi:MAG: amidohydrolase family protein [Phycisphaerales bacterium]|nr:amidohydrolase family protein [Planctomycetota bacterium]MCH8507468.1 amidohydrolase family protein [Phycisphaerales bacterium]
MNPHPHPDLHPDRPAVVRLDAAAIADASLGVVAPGALLLRIHPDQVVVLAAGLPHALEAPGLPAPDRVLSLPDRLLMPGLVNAHTHLDLTHIGPMPHQPGDGFVAWVHHIRAARHDTPEGIAEAVRSGIALSIAGGTVAVGDIAGAPHGRLTDTPARVLGGSPLAGVSYLEFFGIGRSAAPAIERLERFVREALPGLSEATGPVRIGLQPHAPNTVDLGVYRWAAALADRCGLPLATHLAETPEEHAFIARGTGPQRAMLEQFGLWDDSVLQPIAKGREPVRHLAGLLGEHRVLCAHVNDASDAAVRLLGETGTPVVYCPRASAYFGAPDHFGPHRYRDMLDAGVPVCLGTDSIVNLDTPDRISVLDEMRLLHRRDGSDARTLLAMATVHGATALGLDPDAVTLGPGPLAGLLAVPTDGGDPWAGAMGGNGPPEVLILKRECF